MTLKHPQLPPHRTSFGALEALIAAEPHLKPSRKRRPLPAPMNFPRSPLPLTGTPLVPRPSQVVTVTRTDVQVPLGGPAVSRLPSGARPSAWASALDDPSAPLERSRSPLAPPVPRNRGPARGRNGRIAPAKTRATRAALGKLSTGALAVSVPH